MRAKLTIGLVAIALSGAVVATPSAKAATPPTVGGCAVFPANNPWNTDISTRPRHFNSDRIIRTINATGGRFLHADFGGNGEYGIPFMVVNATQATWPIRYTAYGDESDPGPFPIPKRAPIEGGATSDGDRHVIVVQRGSCRLFELYRAFQRGNRWDADSGATWNLSSNRLRPAGWTSADAAGLPILPGLARCSDMAAGRIDHALRVTFSRTRKGYVSPARHYASSITSSAYPAMGMRLRLKSSFSLSGYTGQSRIILTALKKYGLMVADNGSNWFITGAAESCWNDDDLNQLKRVPGSAFEVVNTGPVVTS